MMCGGSSRVLQSERNNAGGDAQSADRGCPRRHIHSDMIISVGAAVVALATGLHRLGGLRRMCNSDLQLTLVHVTSRTDIWGGAVTRRMAEPLSLAHLRWRSLFEGGRQSGAPRGPFFAATAVFVHGDDEQVIPDWPASGEHFSVMLEYIGNVETNEVDAKVDFIAGDLVSDELRPDARFIVMEGRHQVADAWITKVFTE